MSGLKNQLHSQLDQILKPHGFRKSGSSWSAPVGEQFSLAINCQKSSWGTGFYLNAGLFLSKPGLKGIPKIKDWDVYGRIDGGDSERMESLLDFENPVNEEVRFKELKECLDRQVTTLLSVFSDKARAKDYLEAQNGFLPKQSAIEFFHLEFN